MSQSLNIIPWLRELSALECRKYPTEKNTPVGIAGQIDSLRAQIPTAILSHHDGLRARKKPSVAPVTRGHCGACHLAISRGRLLDLRRNVDALNICDHCGVFIYLAEEEYVNATDPLGAQLKRVSKKTKANRLRSPASDSQTRKALSSH